MLYSMRSGPIGRGQIWERMLSTIVFKLDLPKSQSSLSSAPAGWDRIWQVCDDASFDDFGLACKDHGGVRSFPYGPLYWFYGQICQIFAKSL